MTDSELEHTLATIQQLCYEIQTNLHNKEVYTAVSKLREIERTVRTLIEIIWMTTYLTTFMIIAVLAPEFTSEWVYPIIVVICMLAANMIGIEEGLQQREREYADPPR
jgi:hypothetical protein